MNRKFHTDNTLPTNGEVFVFGSNYGGRHGKGAALVAKEQFGAKYGEAKGYQYSDPILPGARVKHCYAIPTKNSALITLSLEVIKSHVETFIYFSRSNQHTFFVTRVGCGLAGYKDEQIAPMFSGCGDNVIFPEEWKPYLEPKMNYPLSELPA